jgi:hypothetical protein
MAKCDNDSCGYISQTHNDLRPYKIDWTTSTEYIPGHSYGDYNKLCSNCWNRRLCGPVGKEYLGDTYLYKMGGVNIPDINWDDPLGEKCNQIIHITNNYITNNNINNDHINMTYNTSNYNINIPTPSPSKIDIGSVIDALTKPQKNRDDKAKSDAAKWDQKQKDFDEKLKKQQEEYENKIKLEVAQMKKERLNRLREEEEQIAEFKKDYPDDKPMKCHKCKVMKAYPSQYTNGKGKPNFDNICNGCLENKRDNTALYRKEHTIVCECGLRYVHSSDSAKEKHENTDRHKKNMQSKLKFDGKKYSVMQLRQICVANQVLNSSRMSKIGIVEALNKLPNVIIPCV